MTFEERAEWERREALRLARFEAFVQRTLEAEQARARAGQKVLEMRLKKQPQLDFAI